MGYLAKTQDLTPANLRRATVVGSVLASFCVEGFSVDTLRDITMDHVIGRYNAFRRLTQIDGVTL